MSGSSHSDFFNLEAMCVGLPDGQLCCSTALIACPGCYLVTYCGTECKASHWEQHKRECPGVKKNLEQLLSRDVSSTATRIPGSCWAPSPAIDVLNIEKNEGVEFDGSLQLLFAGEAGIRHFIYSVANLSSATPLSLRVCITDSSSSFNLARTLLALLILRDPFADPSFIAEVLIQVWYSSKLPMDIYQYLCNHPGQLIDRIAKSYQERFSASSPSWATDLQRVTLSENSWTVNTSLSCADWCKIRAHLVQAPDLDEAGAALIRALDIQKHAEPWQKAVSKMTPARAAGLQKWRSDGLLLPYCHPRVDYRTLNPLFFSQRNNYPAGASEEPLSEWPMELLDNDESPATNDVYGKMFFWLRNLLVKFQKRAREMDLVVHVYPESIDKLTEFHNEGGITFDRVEVGSSWEHGPLITMLSACKLLRHEDENPFATLLTSTRQSVTEIVDSVQKDLKQEKQLLYKKAGTVLDEYAPPLLADERAEMRDIVRRQTGLLLWRNWDRFSEHYMKFSERFKFAADLPLTQDEKETSEKEHDIFTSGFLGLKPKPKNTIRRRWPNRLVHNKKDIPMLQAFNRWLGWPENMPERWFEWKNAGDLTSERFQTLLSHGLTAEAVGEPGEGKSL
ncbi:hypothetical protein S7711_03317 [Stachybotrys chartarum IBT 7711]|uniref:MYND-type domain-containing protein n=1 Tax=Stachybotrys chartarum (strain CBS 109288 / IBT 7711) TaxID=1280523 RepID=A0A084AUN5_STACB|nr:hypothetical protein S7711_03317 [Stachybotrys chartarum IBT 7711]